MKRIIAVAAVLLGGGCAGSGYDGGNLVPGQASAAEVEKSMGTVAARTKGADGGSVLWFSRQPAGRVIYAARISKDDKLIGVEQTLTRGESGEDRARQVEGG